MTQFLKAVKPILLFVSLALPILRLAEIAAEISYPEFNEPILYATIGLEFIYYPLACFIIYAVFKSTKTIIFKLLISICVLFVFAPISMLILLLMDNDIFAPFSKMQNEEIELKQRT